MNVVVVGAGTMGSGIAYTAAAAGHNVAVVEQDQKLLDAGLTRVQQYIDRAISRGHLPKDQDSTVNSKLHGTIDFSEACKNANLVVEAVFEDPNIKEKVFSTIDKYSPKEAILASNTSSISITRLARATKRPDKVLGLHFFNPVPTMKLVELIKGAQTSPTTVKTASTFVESLGKTVVESQDKTGFIVNKALMPFLNESIKLLEQGIATKEDIDKAFVLGTNHPMGPLQLSDFIGVDVVYQTLKVLEGEYGACFKPSSLLERMVKEGRLGRKSGKGFYDY
ncbi:3-hydroxyacyl-CoA dehydrogenase family protein [Candidatus Bathyarchaeota archaeon]|nr:3-hydroxyacyl-CoA dehydrogenase family protein [Candidatus Bathyarchaeota archaeon]